MQKSKKTFLIIFGIIVLAVLFLGWRVFFPGEGTAGVPCNNPAILDPADLHKHPTLKIVINGATTTMPDNLGLSPSCHRVLHTHDDALTEGGFKVIHIEPDFKQNFTLGDFFSVWGKPFSSSTILEYGTADGGKIIMTVDGAVSGEFENLILKDGQKIFIEYRGLDSEMDS